MSLNGQQVLVLNRAYLLTNIIDWRRAVALVYGGKAEAVSESDSLEIRTVRRNYRLPSVIRLLFYSGFPRYSPRFTRRNVYLRDDFTCQYCGQRREASRLNLDHVIPLSRGGYSGWTNVVCSCLPCNRRKRDKLTFEAGMRLRREPKAPANHLFYRLKGMEVPGDWDDFLYWKKKEAVLPPPKRYMAPMSDKVPFSSGMHGSRGEYFSI